MRHLCGNRDRKVSNNGAGFCFEWVIYMNLVTELLYPDGMYMTSGNLYVSERRRFLGLSVRMPSTE